MSKIQKKVHNIEIVLEDIKKLPQTYQTILEDEVSNGTYQVILRRKLNKLCKRGEICKSRIPGTRFGMIIFFCFPKKYHILILSSRTGSEVYCFFKFKKLSRFYIALEEYYQLKGGRWKKFNKTKKIFEGNVLKWV